MTDLSMKFRYRVQGPIVYRLPLIPLLLFLVGCGVTQPVRVLERHEVRVTTSFGGPVIPSSIPTVVIPYGTVGAMVGVSEGVTVTGSLHLPLVALETVGIDGGAAVRIARENGFVPEVTAKGTALILTDFKPGSFRLFPQISVNGSYSIGESVLGYGGLENMFQFTGTEHFFLGPFVGLEIRLSRRFALQGEAKWMAANIDTRNGIFEGQASFRGKGYFGLFLGASYVW
jgi:hypothetical protein